MSIKQIDMRTLEQTYKLGGKVVSITKMTLSPDGKTMKSFVELKVSPVKMKSTVLKH